MQRTTELKKLFWFSFGGFIFFAYLCSRITTRCPQNTAIKFNKDVSVFEALTSQDLQTPNASHIMW